MNKKVVFFDIDGTLLDHDKKLPQSTKESIQILKEQGIYVAIATGRAPFMFEDLREELDIDTFVSFNGQYVVFEGEVLYKNPLKIETLKHINNYSLANNHPLIFLNHETMKATVDNHPFIHESMGSLKFKHPERHDSFHLDNDIYQTLIFIEEQEEELYKNEYNSDIDFIRWHQYSMDILPKGGSKALGINKMMERLGIQRENVFAFGDGLNDLEMLSFVGTGVAMGNAHPKALKVADVVTKDVADDGIKHGLELIKLL